LLAKASLRIQHLEKKLKETESNKGKDGAGVANDDKPAVQAALPGPVVVPMEGVENAFPCGEHHEKNLLNATLGVKGMFLDGGVVAETEVLGVTEGLEGFLSGRRRRIGR
jgi:hypothetical protein